MFKTIRGVDYRHAMTTAYVRVQGRTEHSALRNAKRIGSTLVSRLPDDAIVQPPRKVGFIKGDGVHIFEIPVIIGTDMDAAKAILSEVELKGAA